MAAVRAPSLRVEAALDAGQRLVALSHPSSSERHSQTAVLQPSTHGRFFHLLSQSNPAPFCFLFFFTFLMEGKMYQVSYHPIPAAIPLNLNKCCNKDSGGRRISFQQLAHVLSVSVLRQFHKNRVILAIGPTCSKSKLLHYCRGKRSIQRKQKEINACTCTRAFRVCEGG